MKIIILVVAFVCSSSFVYAEVYKCESVNGTVYSMTPCSPSAKTVKVEEPKELREIREQQVEINNRLKAIEDKKKEQIRQQQQKELREAQIIWQNNEMLRRQEQQMLLQQQEIRGIKNLSNPRTCQSYGLDHSYTVCTQ